MQYLKPLLALVVAGAALAHMLSGGEIERAPGQLAPDDPQQHLLTSAERILVGEFTLEPRARYDIAARVLSVERYHVGVEAKLSPIDYAVGWGEMSDSDVLKHYRLSQGSRFFSIHPDEQAIPLRQAMLQASNMHLIPANRSIEKTLLSARAGHIAQMSGYLVKASRNDGFVWNSSLSREDQGPGACELMYVDSITLR
jgi:hypothetical protein